jgi:methyltransferase family protein
VQPSFRSSLLQEVPPVAARRRVGDFLSPCSFWFPERLCESAWIEHAPFAFWLVDAHRPATLVELGTHWGYSFFAFCQAVHALGLGTRCFAVDTWKGDDHAGRYGEEVFASVDEHNEGRYATFARLMRATFEEAAPSFAGGSIDLLHVDGRHFYEDVRYDFECWRSKLSPRAIVLFHDTAVHESEFGVHRLWEELRQQYPYFEFLHGHGLGILGVGPQVGARLQALFEAGKDAGLAQQIRLAYARLGAGLAERFDRIKQSDLLALKEEDLAAHVAELARLRQGLAAAAKLANQEVDAMKASASWRLTRPLRFAVDTARLLVRPLRRRQ